MSSGATSNERAARKNSKINSAQRKNAREYWPQPTLSSEDRQSRKKYKRYCLRLNHTVDAIMNSEAEAEREHRRRKVGVVIYS